MKSLRRKLLVAVIVMGTVFWFWVLWPSLHYGRFPLFNPSNPHEVALNRVARATQWHFAQYAKLPTTLAALAGTKLGASDSQIFSSSDVQSLKAVVYMPRLRQTPVSLEDRIIAFNAVTEAEVLVVRFNGRVSTMSWDKLRESVLVESPTTQWQN